MWGDDSSQMKARTRIVARFGMIARQGIIILLNSPQRKAIMPLRRKRLLGVNVNEKIQFC